MKRFLCLLIMVAALNARGQQFYTNLYGFRLGQYREATRNQLGLPFKAGKEDDGFEYEAFLLPGKVGYVAFEYAANDTKRIWSIQFTGTSSSIDPGFKNLRLGMDPTEVGKLLERKISVTVKDIGEYGNLLSYDKTNLSVEINKNHKLSSIKILDNSNDIYPGAPDVKKIPAFEKIQKTLTSNDNAEILTLLAGDVEVYYKGHTYSFKKSFSNEQSTDYSQVLSTIKTISKDLLTVNTKNPDVYEENIRLKMGENPQHVIKLKKGHLIKEIVLKYFGGQYYIYEIVTDSK
jgi:hypothetical protein